MTALVLTSNQIRAAEEHAMVTVPEHVLMARAADAVAAEAEAMLAERTGRIRDARVAVVAGSGSNGGDAMLAGARLHYRGAHVTVVTAADHWHEHAHGECEAAGTAFVDAAAPEALTAVRDAHLVIDGIVGVGARPGLRSPADAVVAAIPPGTAVLAVDLPSGLDVDSGDLAGAHVRATATVTFTALKPCLTTEPARASAGRIVIADVGVPRQRPA